MGTDGSTADLTFPTAPAAFGADYAIAINNVSGAPAAYLFEIVSGGSHTFVANLDTTEVIACSHVRFRLTLADLGLAAGDTFDWVATLLNTSNGFRSNEFQGQSAAPAGNIGAAAHTMGAGFDRFTAVTPLKINELDADQPSTDTVEFVELTGGPGTNLDGTALVLFNGADDGSYLAVDLDGLALDGSGYVVVGNAGVSGVARTFPNDSLQNGADGVGLYLADASAFPNDTPVTGTDLVDGLVYGTGDGDDPALSAALLATGEVAVDEAAGGDSTIVSVGRCPDGSGGAGEASVYQVTPPTPGAANDCDPCGNGAIDSGESCDDGAANGTSSSCCTISCTFQPMGTACGDPTATDCDAPDTCSMTGTCEDRLDPPDTECRADTGPCDVAEVCDGTSKSCPPDSSEPDGTACGDGTVCNGDEVCMSGSCMAGTAPDCDDSDPCTADSCAEPGGCMNTPIAGCGDMGPPESDMGPPESDMGPPAEDMGPAEMDLGTPDEDMGPAPMDLGIPAEDMGPADDMGSDEDMGAADEDGSVSRDAGALDAGFEPPFDDDDGCSCRTPGGSSSAPWAPALLLLGLALALRRRR